MILSPFPLLKDWIDVNSILLLWLLNVEIVYVIMIGLIFLSINESMCRLAKQRIAGKKDLSQLIKNIYWMLFLLNIRGNEDGFKIPGWKVSV
jgi:hypothetical protein